MRLNRITNHAGSGWGRRYENKEEEGRLGYMGSLGHRRDVDLDTRKLADNAARSCGSLLFVRGVRLSGNWCRNEYKHGHTELSAWVQFLQPNPTHRKAKTLDPQTNPTHTIQSNSVQPTTNLRARSRQLRRIISQKHYECQKDASQQTRHCCQWKFIESV